MEFLVINMIEDSSLQLHVIHRPFYWRILQKLILYSKFTLQIHTNKSARHENSSLFMNNIFRMEKRDQKTREKFKSEKIQIYVQEPWLKMPIKNSISGQAFFVLSILKVAGLCRLPCPTVTRTQLHSHSDIHTRLQLDQLLRTQSRTIIIYCSVLSLTHCKQDPIYVFPEMKLCDLVPNFHIHVSVSDLYIPRICPPTLLQQI